MTSRERLKTSLDHREPDRVPIDSNGFVSSIHEDAYARLLEELDLEEEPVILDPVQRIALNSEKLLTRLGVDTRYLYPNPPPGWEYRETSDGRWNDEFGSTFKRVGYYADCVLPALKGKRLAEIKAYRFPDPEHPDRFRGMREKAERMHRSTSYALVSGALFCLDYLRWVLRGLEDSILDTAENSPAQEYLLDAILEWMMAYGGRILDQIGDHIEFFWVGDDWGTQSGCFYGPSTFRRVFKPRIGKLISHLKSKTGARCAYHCCGSVYWAVGDLIDVGVDILHPLQPNAKDNEDTARIKREFGHRITFHGGTNNQGLFHRSAAELSVDTLGRISDLAPGGGYIFSSGHNIQATTPPGNIVELFQLARVFGTYPIDHPRIERERKKRTAQIPKAP